MKTEDQRPKRRPWRRLLGAACVLGLLAGSATGARAIKRNFAGSAQLDYLAVPTADTARAITLR